MTIEAPARQRPLTSVKRSMRCTTEVVNATETQSFLFERGEGIIARPSPRESADGPETAEGIAQDKRHAKRHFTRQDPRLRQRSDHAQGYAAGVPGTGRGTGRRCEAARTV